MEILIISYGNSYHRIALAMRTKVKGPIRNYFRITTKTELDYAIRKFYYFYFRNILLT